MSNIYYYEKLTFSKLQFYRKENLKKCTIFEEQKGTRYNRRKVYFGIIIFSCPSSAKSCLRFLLICFDREIKGIYQSSLGNEVDYTDRLINIFPNILTKNWNFIKLRQHFVDKRAMIKTTLTFSCHRKTLVPFWLRKKIPENAFLTLTVNYSTFLLKKNYDILKILRTHIDAEHPTRWWEEETLMVESTYTGNVYCICRYMHM